jgi:hypothetical protein
MTVKSIITLATGFNPDQGFGFVEQLANLYTLNLNFNKRVTRDSIHDTSFSS